MTWSISRLPTYETVAWLPGCCRKGGDPEVVQPFEAAKAAALQERKLRNIALFARNRSKTSREWSREQLLPSIVSVPLGCRV